MSFTRKLQRLIFYVVPLSIVGLFTFCSEEISIEKEVSSKEVNTIKKYEQKSPANRTEACEVTVYESGDANHIVETSEELAALLKSDILFDNDIVYLKDNTTFLFNNGIPNDIKKSIKLVSGGPDNGAIIKGEDATNVLFRVLASNVTFSGLKIYGDFDPESENSFGIKVVSGQVGSSGDFVADGFLLENSELAGWTYSGVLIKDAKNCRISKNNIHDNIKSGLGYGVSLELAGEVLITCNNFDMNRHDIAGDGYFGQRYEASYNTVGREPIKNMHRFDMHGEATSGSEGVYAGEYVSIHHNDFNRGDNTGLAIAIRGIPGYESDGDLTGATIYGNNFNGYECRRLTIRQKIQDDIRQSNNYIDISVNDDPNDADSNTYIPAKRPEIELNNDFILLNNNRRFMRYTLGDYCDCYTDIVEVGNIGPNYKGYFVGNWTNSGSDDLIGWGSRDNMYLLPYNNTFYGQSGFGKVGTGFENYTRFFVGDWIGDQTDELLGFSVIEGNTRLKLFTFDGTQLSENPIDVGGYGSNYKNFFVGNFIGDEKLDLIGLTHDGRMFLWPFTAGKFRGGGILVASGLHAYSKFLVGNWSGNTFDEFMAVKIEPTHNEIKKPNNELFLFSIDNSGVFAEPLFKGLGFANIKEYIVQDFDNNGRDDLILVDNNNTIIANKYRNDFNTGRIHIGCVEDYQVFLNGQWRN